MLYSGERNTVSLAWPDVRAREEGQEERLDTVAEFLLAAGHD